MLTTFRACPERAVRESGPRVEGRKVRTPQGSAPGNARSGQPEGKWHRTHTAFRLAVGPRRPLAQGRPEKAQNILGPALSERYARADRESKGKGEKVR